MPAAVTVVFGAAGALIVRELLRMRRLVDRIPMHEFSHRIFESPFARNLAHTFFGLREKTTRSERKQ